MSIADRMAVLEAGSIRQVGAPTDVYDRPASDYVARLLGSPMINILDAEGADGKVRLAGGAIALDAAAVPAGTVRIGVRPENLALCEGADATVYEVEPLGSFTVVTLTAGEERLRALLRGQPAVTPDARVGLHVDPAKLHFFAEDGRRVATSAA